MNRTFMEQDRVVIFHATSPSPYIHTKHMTVPFLFQYFATEFSKKYIAKLVRAKTTHIKVQIAGGPSTTMVIYRSSDTRYNLSSGWLAFAAANSISLHTICIFHFYRAGDLRHHHRCSVKVSCIFSMRCCYLPYNSCCNTLYYPLLSVYLALLAL